MPKIPRDPLDRFWDKVQKSPEPDGCWFWTGALSHRGYGFFKATSTHQVKAHRFAFEAFVGPIPSGMFVCHRCDNPACIRPDHLFLGTHRDNMRDMAKKGRAATGTECGAYTHPETRHYGERNVNARLTANQVRAIRKAYRPVRGAIPALARQYGISPQSMRSIVMRETWRHVTDSD